MAETSEMACVYAALILHDDGIPITEDKIKTLTDAAGIKVEPYWPPMFARLLETVNMDDLISNIGAAPAAAPAGAPAGEAAEETKEEEKEESEEEEEEEMEFDLFD
ncbi:60S acidic ribosomal protein P1 [Gracilariopsis chorda]|uniref:60S acidic ribosomal protein P1 n=1 Tax=Gracilariopsis chorda TaxID=448386 RepID=A0A2V3J612_9FLOR|nr:60S acidic ribosomal protein P1 [Gracilariopsis chorda]|eukprot:PXF49427.1 60S acidic ribosomal protein P1 [Gracilariopsis chorda]